MKGNLVKEVQQSIPWHDGPPFEAHFTKEKKCYPCLRTRATHVPGLYSLVGWRRAQRGPPRRSGEPCSARLTLQFLVQQAIQPSTGLRPMFLRISARCF